MVMLEHDPADFCGFEDVHRVLCEPAHRSSYRSDVRLIIGAAQPLGDQRWFVAALDLYRREPVDFDAAFDVPDRMQRKSSADARARWDGSGKSQTVESIIDPQFKVALNDYGFIDELREHGDSQETVSDGRPVGRFVTRSLRVDVDPLMVARDLGEVVDLRLGDFMPAADADLLADAHLNSSSVICRRPRTPTAHFRQSHPTFRSPMP